jgi:hypothetical protein
MLKANVIAKYVTTKLTVKQNLNPNIYIKLMELSKEFFEDSLNYQTIFVGH